MIGELGARWVVAVAAGGLLVTGLTVLVLEWRSRRPAPVERDTGPLAPVNFVGILGFAGVGLGTASWRLGMVPLPPGWAEAAIRSAGLILLGLAGLLAAWGLLSIGRQMSSQAEVRPDTEVVTTGAFGVVRHPLYLSILLLWAGGTLALASWLMAACTLVLTPLFVARARLEERMLLRHFGEAYAAYVRRVPMLLPGRWSQGAAEGAGPTAPSDAVNPRRCVMAEVQSEVVSEVESSKDVARAVWGLLLIWTGAAVFLRWGWGVGAVGAGAILLGAQAVRRYRRLAVDVFGLIAGALLVVSGAGNLLQVAIDLFPLLIIAAGLVLLVSAWTSRARHAPGGRSELHAPPRL